MFSALARLWYDDTKKHGEELIAVSSVTLGRPFCSVSYLFWSSFPTLQPFHIASKCTLFISLFISLFLSLFISLYFFSEGSSERFRQLTIHQWSALFLPLKELSVFLIFWRIDVVYHHSVDVMLFWARLDPSISILVRSSWKKKKFSSQQNFFNHRTSWGD